MKKASIIICMVIIITAAASYFFLPDTIPTHFNGKGQIDAYGNRAMIFFPAALSLAISALLLLSRKIDPKKANYKRFEHAFYTFICLMNIIILGIMLIMIIESVRPNSLNVNLMMCLLMGMMFMMIGNIFPKIKANYMMGIKSPWTLASEDVWYKTHRMAGKVWFIGGFLMMFGGFLPDTFTVFYMMSCVIVLALIPYIYSYFIYQKLELSDKDKKGQTHDRN